MVAVSPILMEFFLKPRRDKVFGAPPSHVHVERLPWSSFTSMYRYECGLVHSTLLITPVMRTALVASYSAAKEWCASIGTTAAANKMPRTAASLIFMP